MVMPMGFSSNMSSYGSQNSNGGNVYQALHQKYGCGYADFGHRATLADCPLEISASKQQPQIKSNWFHRLFRNYFE